MTTHLATWQPFVLKMLLVTPILLTHIGLCRHLKIAGRIVFFMASSGYKPAAAKVATQPMRGFKSPDRAPRFLHIYGALENLFRRSRNRVRAAHYRMLRARSFHVWATVRAA